MIFCNRVIFCRRVIRKIVERESVEAAPSRGSRIGETCAEYVAIVVHQQNISDSGNRVRFGWGEMGWGDGGLFREENTCLLLQHFILFFCCSIEGNVLLITFHPRYAHQVEASIQMTIFDILMTAALFCWTMSLQSLESALLLLTIYHLRLRY